MKKLFLLLPLLLLMSGCWNYRELNELAITTGIAIDKENDNYTMTILISNSKKSGSSSDKSQPATAVYEGEGKTLYEAIKETATKVSKQIYLGHIDILILSEEVLQDDVSHVIDFLFRYPQTRNEFQLVISRDCKAGDILKITTPLEGFPSQNVAQNLNITSELQGIIYTVDFNEFVKALLNEGQNPVLPSVEIIGDVEDGNKEENIEQSEPKTILKLGTLGLFKDNRLITWADINASRGINIINNKVSVLGVKSPCNSGSTVTEITEMKTSIEAIDNGKKFKIKVKATGSIQELSCNIDLEVVGNIDQIKEKNIEKLKEYIDEAINLAKENKTDIFGFGNTIYKDDPKYWKEIKDSWESDLFPNIEIEYDIELNLDAKGKINTYIEVKD